jgi:hypothetical protein
MISHTSSDYATEEQDDTFDADRSAFAPPFQTLEDRSRQQSRAFAGLSTRGSHASAGLSLREKKLEVNWKAFEVLQRQNEVLSCRLKELQVCSKLAIMHLLLSSVRP